jgi:hypothetical protein
MRWKALQSVAFEEDGICMLRSGIFTPQLTS